jgi:hypothetical protein
MNLSYTDRRWVDLNPVARHSLTYKGTHVYRNPKLVANKNFGDSLRCQPTQHHQNINGPAIERSVVES